MYVLVREDLSFPQQAVQAIHAAMEAQKGLVPADLDDTPNVVLCVVPDAPSLMAEAEKLRNNGVRFVLFEEPDIPDPHPKQTALATEPVAGDARRAFKHLKLLKETPR